MIVERRSERGLKKGGGDTRFLRLVPVLVCFMHLLVSFLMLIEAHMNGYQDSMLQNGLACLRRAMAIVLLLSCGRPCSILNFIAKNIPG